MHLCVTIAFQKLGSPGKLGDEARGQTERFLVLFEKTSFADNDWKFSEWGELPVCPKFPSPVSECSSRKSDRAARDFLRALYRQGRLTPAELDTRLRALKDLAAGRLRPLRILKIENRN